VSVGIWLILGLVAGCIASHLAHYHRQSLFLDIAVGIAGAFVGGAVFHLIGGYGFTRFHPWSVLPAIGGAVLALLAWNALSSQRPIITR
jgi:uncharacterized membrane protein YeaQ/YmgE (transglycosylase-associated protein family)